MVNVELRPGMYGGYVVVALRGELDTVEAVSAASVVAAAGRRVIIDLGALEFIDCRALDELLGVRELARQAGGDVLLAAPQGLVLRLLTLIGMDGMHASVAAAVESVGRGSGGPAIWRRAIGAIRAGGQRRQVPVRTMPPSRVGRPAGRSG